ncbi:hypothetical protein [Bradyrhizobium sp. USDA 4353]
MTIMTVRRANTSDTIEAALLATAAMERRGDVHESMSEQCAPAALAQIGGLRHPAPAARIQMRAIDVSDPPRHGPQRPNE